MGSDNTSKFEVKSQKSQKRTKKKDKSKDFVNKTSCDADTAKTDNDKIKETNKQNVMSKKRKDKKQKLNSHNNSHKGRNDEQENNVGRVQKDSDEEDLDEASPPKKLQKANNVDDTDECDKPNAKVPKEPSKRQLKREKAEKKENEKREANRLDAMKKGLNYVSKWKHARTEWKFEKLRQIWLIDNLLDDTSIPDDIFPTVLEYFEGCKGMAREQLLKKGMDVIRKVEEDEENKEQLESVAYQRARKLLQVLPTET